jgi:adenylosuccinate lyase
MAVHPIEERYDTAEMQAVGGKQNRFSCIVRTEIALAASSLERGRPIKKNLSLF